MGVRFGALQSGLAQCLTDLLETPTRRAKGSLTGLDDKKAYVFAHTVTEHGRFQGEKYSSVCMAICDFMRKCVEMMLRFFGVKWARNFKGQIPEVLSGESVTGNHKLLLLPVHVNFWACCRDIVNKEILFLLLVVLSVSQYNFLHLSFFHVVLTVN